MRWCLALLKGYKRLWGAETPQGLTDCQGDPCQGDPCLEVKLIAAADTSLYGICRYLISSLGTRIVWGIYCNDEVQHVR